MVSSNVTCFQSEPTHSTSSVAALYSAARSGHMGFAGQRQPHHSLLLPPQQVNHTHDNEHMEPIVIAHHNHHHASSQLIPADSNSASIALECLRQFLPT